MKRYRMGLAALLVMMLASAAWAAAPMVSSRGLSYRIMAGQGTGLTLRQMTTTASTKIVDYQNQAGTTVFSVDREGDVVAVGTLTLGSAGTALAGYISGTATVDFAEIADGDDGVANVTVTGAAVGDPAIAGLTTLTTEDVLVTAKVSATNTVEVVLLNRSGGAVDLASGTLRASVFKH